MIELVLFVQKHNGDMEVIDGIVEKKYTGENYMDVLENFYTLQYAIRNLYLMKGFAKDVEEVYGQILDMTTDDVDVLEEFSFKMRTD